MGGGTSEEDSYGGDSDDEDEPFVPPTPEQILAAVEAERHRIPLTHVVEAKTPSAAADSGAPRDTPASLSDKWGTEVETPRRLKG